MLWAKDVRQQMLSIHPDLDFATISRKLGEMWANVPSNEKYNWRRRAKRLSSKGKDKVISKSLSQAAVPSTKFINRNTSPSKTKPKRTPIKNAPSADIVSNDAKSPKLSPTSSNSVYKSKPGTQPADVAAHLQLLGESLTIIGERLKEHEVSLIFRMINWQKSVFVVAVTGSNNSFGQSIRTSGQFVVFNITTDLFDDLHSWIGSHINKH